MSKTQASFLSWYTHFWALNILISFIISLLYISTPSAFPQSMTAAIFGLPYFLGHLGLLLLLLVTPVFFLLSLSRSHKFCIWALAGFMAFLQTLLLIDTFVYQQYRFHINLFVLDLFFNGQGQIISFSWFLWALVIGFVLMLYIFEVWLGYQSLKMAEHSQSGRRAWKLAGIWFLCVLGSHLAHIYADGVFYKPITRLAFIPPFAVPANAQAALIKYELVDVEKHKSQALLTPEEEEKSTLHYPIESLKCQAPAQKLNMLVIMVDSLRYDHLSAIAMPHTFEFAQKATIFDEHFSGSNSTRGGIFSVFYGLPPLYFEKFREAHVGPVIMDLFIKNQYELGIFSSAPLTKPEFDQTVFAQVQNLRKKSKTQAAFDRDSEITDEWIKFTESRNQEKPFFGFLFYDSAHEFSNAPGHTPFKPYLEDINYFTLNNNTDPTLFLNRYKNSTHYIDSLIGKVLKDLEQRKLLENTIVIFSSDHGKEFNDNKLNYWGHNSNFTNAQTHVPFFVYWPGEKPSHIQKWTSHYDIAPTIAQKLFNCENKASDYSSGDNLYTHPGHKWVLHGTYGDFGIRTKDHFIVIKNTGAYEILDLKYHPIEKATVDYDIYNAALKEMRRFYR